jgi:hypothetical protein
MKKNKKTDQIFSGRVFLFPKGAPLGDEPSTLPKSQRFGVRAIRPKITFKVGKLKF